MALNFPRAAPPQIFRKFGKFDAYAPDPLLVAMPPPLQNVLATPMVNG